MPQNQTMSPDEIDRLARKRAGAKLGWYVHAMVYVVVNLFIFSISQYGFGQRPWSIMPLLGWGLGLALHGMCVNAWCKVSANTCSASKTGATDHENRLDR